MAREIERKFLLRNDNWRQGASAGRLLRQGYLCSGEGVTVRVRVAEGDAWLTIKGPSEGAARDEFEYPIPVEDADYLLSKLRSSGLVEKKRHELVHAELLWEIDEFLGDNAGLVVAEVELEDEGQAITLPEWVGEEVTGDPSYYNASLAQHPHSNW